MSGLRAAAGRSLQRAQAQHALRACGSAARAAHVLEAAGDLVGGKVRRRLLVRHERLEHRAHLRARARPSAPGAGAAHASSQTETTTKVAGSLTH
jgi:hypothetical protein